MTLSARRRSGAMSCLLPLLLEVGNHNKSAPIANSTIWSVLGSCQSLRRGLRSAKRRVRVSTQYNA